ncbi:MAG: phosphodiesterase, partial [Rubrivivax sp.]
MNTPADPHPLQRLLALWHAGSLRGTRSLAVALAGLVAAYIGAVALPLQPWSPLALSGGVGLAATLRWGAGGTLGAAGGVLLALLSMAVPPATALVAAAAQTAGLLAAGRLLH